MDERRSNIGFGIILILIGAWFLATQFIPDLRNFISVDFDWPWWVIGAGLAFLVMAILLRAPGMAVPAAIISGIGGILYYQQSTGDWQSWAYLWALIPGFAGVGVILMNLLQGTLATGLREGLSAILFSLVLFAIFSGFLGGPRIFSQLWPAFLILAGAWILLKGRFVPSPDKESTK